MRRLICFTVAALALVMVFGLDSTSQAKDGYAQAGCGLGSLLFGTDTGKFQQVLAATTNGTGIQTFGITTGTSNCDNPTPGRHATKAFIETNREALAKDVSRGTGDTIASLTALAGCADAGAVGSELQSNFDTIFPNASVTDGEVADSVIKLLEETDALSCGAIS
ncbi:MAG: DUF3015 domain-containing protein [Deltaproteobacteria bacterium]|nr:DUF3015 domain-containing protein [Deltaproteobacteria bacterium]